MAESERLLADLAQRRARLRATLEGLSPDAARSTPTLADVSLAGVVKHAALTERRVIAPMEHPEPADHAHRLHDGTGFGLAGETPADVVAFYTAVGTRTESIVRGLDDLDGSIGFGAPNGGFGNTSVGSVHTVLLRLIEETESHVRAAYIIRGILDEALARTTFTRNNTRSVRVA